MPLNLNLTISHSHHRAVYIKIAYGNAKSNNNILDLGFHYCTDGNVNPMMIIIGYEGDIDHVLMTSSNVIFRGKHVVRDVYGDRPCLRQRQAILWDHGVSMA
jgi:hypothetical protein